MNAMTPIRSRKGRKAKAAPVTLPQAQWDRGAEGKANQERLRVEPATEVDAETGLDVQTGGKRRRRQTWVQLYMRKGDLTPQQAYVAQVLAEAAAGQAGRDALEAVRISIGGTSDPLAARVDARALYRKLWAKCPATSRPVVQRVVLEDQAIWRDCGEDGRQRHLKRLRDGLDAIA